MVHRVVVGGIVGAVHYFGFENAGKGHGEPPARSVSRSIRLFDIGRRGARRQFTSILNHQAPGKEQRGDEEVAEGELIDEALGGFGEVPGEKEGAAGRVHNAKEGAEAGGEEEGCGGTGRSMRAAAEAQTRLVTINPLARIAAVSSPIGLSPFNPSIVISF
jgi:hypothetical protein